MGSFSVVEVQTDSPKRGHFQLSNEFIRAIAELPPYLHGVAREMVQDHQLSLVETRRLVALLVSQPTLSLPVALAMVQAVGKSKVGEVLGRIEQALDELPAPEQLTGSERKMTLVILGLLQQRITAWHQALLGL